MKTPAIFLAHLILPLCALPAADQPAPKPQATLTIFVDGVECPSCAYAVNYSISQLQSVTEVEAGQVVENFANVTFDPAQVSEHQIAQAVTDAVPLHGTPYGATLKLFIPAYAQPGNAAKVDALFAKWRHWVELVPMDKATGEFVLHFEELKPKKDTSGPQGWSLALLDAALRAPAPKGPGLDYRVVSESLESFR